MFERSAKVPMSQMPAGMPTKRPAIQVLTCGVRKRLCTLPKTWGRSPSRDIANQTRACPYWKTMSDEIMPTSAPTLTQPRILFIPRAFRASATGAALPRVFQFAMPVRTSATEI